VSERASWIYLASMFGGAAWLLGVPFPLVLFLLVTVAVSTLLLPSGAPKPLHRFRPSGEAETPRRYRGDCRDAMGHEEPPVQGEDA
jgi:hypothetical protein